MQESVSHGAVPSKRAGRCVIGGTEGEALYCSQTCTGQLLPRRASAVAGAMALLLLQVLRGPVAQGQYLGET